MDVGILAQTLTTTILPWLSHLGAKAVEKAAETAGAEGSKAALTSAAGLWARLVSSDKSGKVVEAARGAVDPPGDADAIAALRLRIRQLLEENESLRAEVERSLPAPAKTNNTAIASGAASVAIGGSFSNGSISTNAGQPGHRRRP